MLIIFIHKLLEWFFWMLSKNIFKIRSKCQVVFLNVNHQFITSKYSSYFIQLIIVILTMEKWLLLKDNPCKETSQTPNIQTIIIVLVIQEELRWLEITRCHSTIVIFVGKVKLSQSKIYQFE